MRQERPRGSGRPLSHSGDGRCYRRRRTMRVRRHCARRPARRRRGSTSLICPRARHGRAWLGGRGRAARRRRRGACAPAARSPVSRTAPCWFYGDGVRLDQLIIAFDVAAILLGVRRSDCGEDGAGGSRVRGGGHHRQSVACRSPLLMRRQPWFSLAGRPRPNHANLGPAVCVKRFLNVRRAMRGSGAVGGASQGRVMGTSPFC